jgi:uncharacterized protein
MALRAFGTPVFLVAGRNEGERVVYAPLRRLAFTVNASGAGMIEAIRLGRASGAPAPFVERLADLGLFEVLPDAPPPAGAGMADDYRPTNVTLFLTGRCNLRCSYCYADGGENHSTMPWEIAREALDFVVDNAAATGRRAVKIVFHGDGEPTLAWRLMQRAVAYAERRGQQADVECSFECGVNGVIAESRGRWLARKFSGVTISVDGPADIQNAQRPLASGTRPSSPRVERTLRVLDEAGTSYGIRCTITSLSLNRIPEIVGYLCRVSQAKRLMIEPAFAAGRALRGGARPLNPETFVRGFLAARPIAKRHGRRMLFSGARADQIVSRFCGAIDGAFNVAQDGRVTSCYEVISPGDGRISLFEIGGYRGPGQGFWIDRARIAAAIRWTATEKPACHQCFARYHCAGDCPAKLAMSGDPAKTVNPARCYTIREITRAQIFSLHGFGEVSEPAEHWTPGGRQDDAGTPAAPRLPDAAPAGAG